MRALRALRAEVVDFLDGQEFGLCALHGDRSFLPFVVALLQELEMASGDVFVPLTHEFAAVEPYVELVLERIEMSLRAAREGVVWSLPSECRDPRRAAVQRLIAALECARASLPRGGDRPRLVVVLCPLEVADPGGYEAMCRALVSAPRGAPPWFRRMRIFLYTRSIVGWALPRQVRAVAVDLSSEAMTASARLDAEDPSLTPTQRAEATLQEAMLELGNGRREAARARLGAVYEQAQALDQGTCAVLAALALCGLGDVARIEEERAAAIEWYERALVPAGEAGALVVLLMISRHLADLYLKVGRAADAEIFYEGSRRLAAAMPEPETQVRSLAGRASAQQQRGAAAEVWAGSLAEASAAASANDRGDLAEELRPGLRACLDQALSPTLRRSIEGLLAGGVA